MQKVFDTVLQIAPSRATVLIEGESGTGKELIAAAIHEHSPRAPHAFVKLHCAALAETVLESELFGHEKGAFTGALSRKLGLFELAAGGTIFMDEIGELDPRLQGKLLRALELGTFFRVGGTQKVQTDLRIIAATNQDLPKLVAEGRFREDLFYRINVIPVRLPALRERREDVPLLAEHFLLKYAGQMEKPVTSISREAHALLADYTWPGNVRELENVMERAVALEQTPVVLPESLPDYVGRPEGRPLREGQGRPLREGQGRPLRRASGDVEADLQVGQRVASGEADLHVGPEPTPPAFAEGFNLEAHGEELYRYYMALALEQSAGVQTKAAELLGMSFRSFRYYAKKFNLR
jgi:transcriptional regulator with GAF, ATPase, and Fis domain